MNRIKIGQIGICHEHAVGKMNSLRSMPDVYEIVGVVDDRSTTAASFGNHDDLSPYDGLSWMTEDELFTVPGLQAVTVETPNADLVPTALRCMERGLHMHMDKPSGEEPEPFFTLVAGCRERKLALQLGYMLRSNPAIRFCRKAIRLGWLGDVFQIQADMNHGYGGEEYQQYLAKLNGGIMYNLGCHLIDTFVYLLGKPERVSSFSGSTYGVDSQINNNSLAVLEYHSAIASLRACGLAADGIGRRRLTVCGTKGTFDLCPLERYDGSPLTAQLTLSEGNDEYPAGNNEIEFAPLSDRYIDQLTELARIINGEIENPFSYDHELSVHEVVLSASSGRQVV